MYLRAYQVSGQTSKSKSFAYSPRNRYLYSSLELIPEEVSEVSSREPIVAGSLEPRLLTVALDNTLHEIDSSKIFAFAGLPNPLTW